METQDLQTIFDDAQKEGLSTSTAGILIENLNAQNIAGAQGATLDEIAGDEVTIFCAVLDATGSMIQHRNDVVTAYNEMLKALKDSKASDSILMGTWLFNTSSRVLHGYLNLVDVPELTLHTYQPDHLTALFDATLDAYSGVVAYAQDLRNSGIRTKIVVVVFTDGEDNQSRSTAIEVHSVSKDLLDQEIYTLALVAFGQGFAQSVATEMGIPNVLEVGSTQSEIRRAMGTVSKSVIRASQTRIDPQASASFFS